MLGSQYTNYVIILGGMVGSRVMIILITQGRGDPELGKSWLRNMWIGLNNQSSFSDTEYLANSLLENIPIQVNTQQCSLNQLTDVDLVDRFLVGIVRNKNLQN